MFSEIPSRAAGVWCGLAARAYVTDMECLSLSATTSWAPRSGLRGRSMRIAFAEGGNMPREAATPPPLLEPRGLMAATVPKPPPRRAAVTC